MRKMIYNKCDINRWTPEIVFQIWFYLYIGFLILIKQILQCFNILFHFVKCSCERINYPKLLLFEICILNGAQFVFTQLIVCLLFLWRMKFLRWLGRYIKQECHSLLLTQKINLSQRVLPRRLQELPKVCVLEFYLKQNLYSDIWNMLFDVS